MDPLHPLVPIQPPAPTAPSYNRVERIDRDQQQDPGPDWQRDPDPDAEDEQEQQFEDDYDPDWSDPAAAEPYGPDGVVHESATAADSEPEPERSWDARVDHERRSHPRDGDDDADPGGGPHVDISA